MPDTPDPALLLRRFAVHGTVSANTGVAQRDPGLYGALGTARVQAPLVIQAAETRAGRRQVGVLLSPDGHAAYVWDNVPGNRAYTRRHHVYADGFRD